MKFKHPIFLYCLKYLNEIQDCVLFHSVLAEIETLAYGSEKSKEIINLFSKSDDTHKKMFNFILNSHVKTIKQNTSPSQKKKVIKDVMVENFVLKIMSENNLDLEIGKIIYKKINLMLLLKIIPTKNIKVEDNKIIIPKKYYEKFL